MSNNEAPNKSYRTPWSLDLFSLSQDFMHIFLFVYENKYNSHKLQARVQNNHFIALATVIVLNRWQSY